MRHSARRSCTLGYIHALYEGGQYIHVTYPRLAKQDEIAVINVWDYQNGQTTLGHIPGVSPQKEVARHLVEWLRDCDDGKFLQELVETTRQRVVSYETRCG